MTTKKSAVLFLKKQIACLMLLLQAWPSYADSAHNDLFLHLDTGLSSSRNMQGNYQSHADNSMIFGAGIKYQVLPGTKTGASFAYRPGYEYTNSYNYAPNKGTETAQKFNITSFMINTSYDIINIKDILTPYVEIGMGISHIKLKNYICNMHQKDVCQKYMPNKSRIYTTKTFSGKTFNNFTMNGGVGLVLKINNNMDMDINYKYNDFGKIKYVLKDAGINHTYKGRITTDELMLSFRFKM